jgi:hypothetical protein
MIPETSSGNKAYSQKGMGFLFSGPYASGFTPYGNKSEGKGDFSIQKISERIQQSPGVQGA